MKLPKKRTYILSFVALFVIWMTFDTTMLKKLLSMSIGDRLSGNGYFTEIESSSFHWFGVNAEKVAFHGKSAFESIVLDSANVECSPMILLKNGSCQSDIELYAGTILATINKESVSKLTLSGTAKNIHLEKHLLIRGYGIEEGLLSVPEFSLTRNESSLDISAKIQISELKKPLSSRLSPSLTGLPVPIDIPAIDINSLNAKLKINNSITLISDINMNSSWGSLKGSLSFQNKQLKQAELNVQFLSQGKEAVSAFLPFICPRDIVSEAQIPPLLFKLNNGQFSCARAL